MHKSGKEELRTVLFADGMELVNVKFFPGTGRGLTAGTLASEAAKAFRFAEDAWKAKSPSVAPVTGLAKQSI